MEPVTLAIFMVAFQNGLNSQFLMDSLSLIVMGIVIFRLLQLISHNGHNLLFIPATLFVPLVFYLIYENLLQYSFNEIPTTYILGAGIVSLVVYFLLSDSRKKAKPKGFGFDKLIIIICGIASLILVCGNIYPFNNIDWGNALKEIAVRFLSRFGNLG